jgi:hypothetical protein
MRGYVPIFLALVWSIATAADQPSAPAKPVPGSDRHCKAAVDDSGHPLTVNGKPMVKCDKPPEPPKPQPVPDKPRQ